MKFVKPRRNMSICFKISMSTLALNYNYNYTLFYSASSKRKVTDVKNFKIML